MAVPFIIHLPVDFDVPFGVGGYHPVQAIPLQLVGTGIDSFGIGRNADSLQHHLGEAGVSGNAAEY